MRGDVVQARHTSRRLQRVWGFGLGLWDSGIGWDEGFREMGLGFRV